MTPVRSEEEYMSQPELLTAEEVAALLRVKPSTVYDAAARGVLPVLRLWKGKRRTLIRLRRSDLEAFIQERAALPLAGPNLGRPLGGGRRGSQPGGTGGARE